MQPNEELISRFYSSFQKLDAEGMNECYSENPIFNDQVFGILEGEDVRKMWRMLCKNARDFSLTFGNIQLLDEEYATCNWIAKYTFSASGRKVVNSVKAHMRIQDGKVTEHSDLFDIWKWSRQAMGIPGMLLGWTGFMKRKIRAKARQRLENWKG